MKNRYATFHTQQMSLINIVFPQVTLDFYFLPVPDAIKIKTSLASKLKKKKKGRGELWSEEDVSPVYVSPYS